MNVQVRTALLGFLAGVPVGAWLLMAALERIADYKDDGPARPVETGESR